ncbi:MAG: hypothetical protein M3069_08955 [Chloroflexota bacterium]|nr:hypothetical protein [Chloroflexota bacterium]
MSVWPLLLPVRGRLETILMVPVSVLATAALGDGAAAAGEADGEAAGFADGLAAAEADGLAAGEGAAAAGFGAGAVVAAGAVVGVAGVPLQAAMNIVAAAESDDRRASVSGAPRIV